MKGRCAVTNILGMTKEEIAALSCLSGQPGYRALQIYGWACRGVDVPGMTDIPALLREKLSENGICVRLPEIRKKLVSRMDGTAKYLFAMNDGELVESVLMKYNHGNTVCVSPQAGCRMGCRFCASTLGGLSRNLAANEILGQVMAVSADCGERISNVVMMGIGEPLDNFDNTVSFLHMLNSPDILGIGYRHVSVSTCGVVPGIKKLAEEDLPVTLSVSLHSPDDGQRSRLMPVNRKWGVNELLDACRDYFGKTGRRISFEYTLIAGETDGPENARRLAARLRERLGGMPLHVNLIPLNPVAERRLTPPDGSEAERFRAELEKLGINGTVRRRLGPDINASCGQLRHAAGNSNETEETSC